MGRLVLVAVEIIGEDINDLTITGDYAWSDKDKFAQN